MKYHEETMIKAIDFAFEECKEIVRFQEEAMGKFGKEKIVPELYKVDENLAKKLENLLLI